MQQVSQISYGPGVSFCYLAGPAEEVRKIAEALKAEGVFVREVETLGLAFHSPALEPLLPELRQGHSSPFKLLYPFRANTSGLGSCYPR